MEKIVQQAAAGAPANDYPDLTSGRRCNSPDFSPCQKLIVLFIADCHHNVP